MKNLLKNKKIIILIILIMTLFLTSSKVLGYSFTYDNKKFNTIEIDKLNVEGFGNTGDFCIVKSPNATHGYYLFLMPNDFHVKVRYRDDLKRIYLDYNYAYLKVEFGDDNLTSFGNWYESSFDDGIESVVYSTFGVYNPDDKLVFQAPPVEITQVLLEETTKAGIMNQIKTMIVGFLKYLIALVVSVIAFYKGWKFLSTQLRKA